MSVTQFLFEEDEKSMSDEDSQSMSESSIEVENPNVVHELLDAVDDVLVNAGLEFKDAEKWPEFSEQMAALIFLFYEDHIGSNDSSYKPTDTPSDSQSL